MFHEDKTFNLRFSLEASFPDDYDGDEDHHVWVQDWQYKGMPREVMTPIYRAGCLRWYSSTPNPS